jgi:hypothetical protein
LTINASANWFGKDCGFAPYQDQRFSSTDARRETLIAEWLAGLRRRGDVVDIYATGR